MNYIIKLILSFVVLSSMLTASESMPTSEEVAKIYVATLNRAPDSAGLDYWVNQSGLTLSQIGQSFFDQPETKEFYSNSLINRDFVSAVYENLFSRLPDIGGWDYWENELNIGSFSKDRFIQTVINGALDTQQYGLDATILNNKNSVGIYFAQAGLVDTQVAKSVIVGVTSDIATVNTALTTISQDENIIIGKAVADYNQDTCSYDYQIIVDGICKLKTCESDSYDCPTCTDIQELKYYNNGFGYCETVVENVTVNTPTLISNIPTLSSTINVSVSGNYAYVADGLKGMKIIDISNTDSPTTLSSVSKESYIASVDVVIFENYAYAIYDDNLKIINISNPSLPKILSTLSIPKYTRSISVSGNYAYVADGLNGLQIIDISNPSLPKIVSTIYTSDDATDVSISGNYAYVANSNGGLVIIDISNPSIATKISTTDIGIAKAVKIYGNYAYIATGSYGLHIMDISNPSAPSSVLIVDTPSSASDVSISGNYAYIADGASGLQIVDISNPSSASIISSVDTAGYARGVSISGNYAYVADESSGLQIINISSLIQ